MKTLLICFGCGALVSAPDTECENCGAKKNEDDRGFIAATLTDEEAKRLSHTDAGADLLLDEAR